MHRLFCIAVVVGLAFSPAVAYAQDPLAETPSEAPPSPPARQKPSELIREDQALLADQELVATGEAAAQARAAFDEKFREYKSIIRQIEQLQAEFQSADEAQRERINETMTGQVAHAQTVVNAMVDAAIEAYRLVPEADPQISAFLKSVATYYVQGRSLPNQGGVIDGGDQYEKALPIIKVLDEGGDADQDLYLMGFLSAFFTNQYDLAEHYLKKANEAPAPEENREAQDPAREETLGLVGKFAPMFNDYRQWWSEESKRREAEAEADDLPRVRFTTTKGEIVLELFENEAPETVANFLTLVKDGYYNGKPFHRVIAKFMAQGGAQNADGSGRLGYSIRGEAGKPEARRHFRGSLSMGLLPGRPDSGGAQFFITLVPTPHLDGQHTVFGRVVEGIEVVAELTRREPTGDPQQDAALPKPDRILKAEVLRDREHEYRFEKLSEP